MTDLERVQRAIYLAKWGHPDYDYGIDGVEKALALKQAKAAIAALLPPSEAMVEAAFKANGYGGASWSEDLKANFTAMLGAVLKETGE
ncbi:MAG TPA: hypothetical protein VEA41_07940 [Salinarimonas sp.]|nr:hypothetical protein [Salinarimonas sp.]